MGNPVKMPESMQLWPIERLRPYDRNPRTYSADQVERIAASILEFGFVNPIHVAEEAGIITGHSRLQAAKRLGLVEVPVIECSHLTTAQRCAYIIADNKLAMDAGWDDRLLQEELQSLDLEGFVLDLTGFGETEMSVLLGSAGDFIGGEGLLGGVKRENNNLEIIRDRKDPDSDRAMVGFWFSGVQVSVPQLIYARFEGLVNSDRYQDRREGVVVVLTAGMDHAEGRRR